MERDATGNRLPTCRSAADRQGLNPNDFRHPSFKSCAYSQSVAQEDRPSWRALQSDGALLLKKTEEDLLREEEEENFQHTLDRFLSTPLPHSPSPAARARHCTCSRGSALWDAPREGLLPGKGSGEKPRHVSD